MNWSRVILRYLIIAAVGSVSIIAGTYLLHAYNVDLDEGKEVLRQKGDRFASGITALLQDVSSQRSETNRPADLKDFTLTDQRTNGAVVVQGSSSAPPVRPTQPAIQPKPPKAQPGHWAVVRTVDARAYNRAGKYLRAIPPGTLVDVLDIRDTRVGQLIVCKVLYQGAEVNDVVLMAKDLELRPGALASANPKEKDLRVLQAQVLGQIRDRESDLLEAASKNNPYYAEYKRIQEEYLTFARKAEELTKQRDAATGADKMRIADELRAMKGDDIRLGQTYKAAKQKYQDWKKQNASRASAGTSDPQMAALRAKLAEIENELRNFN